MRSGRRSARTKPVSLKVELLSRYRPPFNMPRAQALLLALRQFLPTVADPVLQRSRELYTASGTA